MIFKLNVRHQGASGSNQVKLRCPSCRQRAIFVPITDADYMDMPSGKTFGQRRCPDPNCNSHIFFVKEAENILISYPNERIDFDSSDLPEAVLEAFEEAIACHSINCYVASAIMVRKTLEELCLNLGATGNNLKDKIKILGTKVILPLELLAGLDDLRLLGNDAAHIESNSYHKVEEDEVSIAIELTKEVLKAVYQYKGLLDKLKSLKK